MSSSHSSLLWAFGNLDDAGSGQLSSLSATCALLALSLRQNTNFIVLHHFCGLHERGYLAGPNRLIRSLLCQVFHSCCRFNLGFINTSVFANDIRSNSLHALCHIFSELIVQLPQGQTVVCIIDGVASFEIEPWLHQLCNVIYMMNSLINKSAQGPIFKLLVTTPFGHGMIDRQLLDHQRLVLQPVEAYGDGGELSHRLIWDEIGQTSRLKYYEKLMEMEDANEDDSDSDEK
ncbi:hypothetical protein BJX70DRAFT_217314 [Aspergillus crustosus]